MHIKNISTSVLVALVSALVLGTVMVDEANAGPHRLVVQASLHSQAGEVVTCMDFPKPESRTLVFTKGSARVKVTIVHVAAEGNEKTQTFDSDTGVPVIDGVIRSVRVEFLTTGTCKLELYIDQNGR